MFSNYVVMYNMSEKVSEITEKSDKELVPIMNSIKNRKNKKICPITKVLSFLNKGFIKKVSTMDKNYIVDGNCNACGICRDVCPVHNIEMQDNKPAFTHNCEQCVACIQFCPQKAINHKNLTQNRRRYTNPDIHYKELAEING